MAHLRNLFFSFFLIFYSYSNELTQLMEQDLDVIRTIFKSQYAPLEWKETYANWNLDQEIERAKNRVRELESPTSKDYHHILKEFLETTKDYHVSATFYSTEGASLPFRLKSANGRYFITALERIKLPKNAAHLRVGDEVIAFNGIPIQDAVEAFRSVDCNQGSILTDQAIAELFFTKRSARIGSIVPQGSVFIDVKHLQNNEEKQYELAWEYHPERIIPLNPKKPDALQKLSANKLELPLNKHSLFHKPMLSPFYECFENEPIEMAQEKLGGRESFVPSLGKKIWESHPKCPYHAYLFETPEGKRLGYLRIGHYSVGQQDSERYCKQFQELINKLEDESEALILDQVNNPGGSMFYMYSLASMLSSQPLYVPAHKVALTPKEISEAIEILPILNSITTVEEAEEIFGKSLDGLPMILEAVRQISSYFNFLVAEWQAGRNLTNPTHLYGVDYIQPSPNGTYTKPILMLINALDMSCGDFLPAILQDNGRATLFGTRTAGAGGFVLSVQYPNLLGVEMVAHTGSIAERVDKNPIENLGVVPDIEYQITSYDLQHQYRGYSEKVLESLRNLLK